MAVTRNHSVDCLRLQGDIKENTAGAKNVKKRPWKGPRIISGHVVFKLDHVQTTQ